MAVADDMKAITTHVLALNGKRVRFGGQRSSGPYLDGQQLFNDGTGGMIAVRERKVTIPTADLTTLAIESMLQVELDHDLAPGVWTAFQVRSIDPLGDGTLKEIQLAI